MPAKLRQLGCVCVAPTPSTHACAAGGRSPRRLVEPWNTMRIVATVADGEDGPGADEPLLHAVNPTKKTSAHSLTLPDYCACARASPLIGVRSDAAGPADTDESAPVHCYFSSTAIRSAGCADTFSSACVAAPAMRTSSAFAPGWSFR